MAARKDKDLSQTYLAKRAQVIIDSSERVLLNALDGTTKLTDRVRVQVALEIYKKRIPQKVEQVETGQKLTLIKIIKNFIPGEATGEVVDITAATGQIEKLADTVIDESVEKAKTKKMLNAQIKAAASKVHRLGREGVTEKKK